MSPATGCACLTSCGLGCGLCPAFRLMFASRCSVSSTTVTRKELYLDASLFSAAPSSLFSLRVSPAMAHDPSPPQESPPFHGQSSLALADVHASRKRPRAGPDGRPAYPRKRAAQACLTCRRKRIKCDNERPSCTSCSALAIECVYQEGDKSRYPNNNPPPCCSTTICS